LTAELVHRIARIPGVASIACLDVCRSISGCMVSVDVRVVGNTDASARPPTSICTGYPGYFQVMRVRMAGDADSSTKIRRMAEDMS
jgi:hypothetical protein